MSITITITTRVNTSKLEQLLRQLKPRADQILDKSAFDIEFTAKSIVPVDTGALRASICVEGPGRGGGGGGGRGAMTAARTAAATHGKTIGFVASPPVEELQRAILPRANYGIYVEARKPFMMPAAEAHRSSFIAAWYAFV